MSLEDERGRGELNVKGDKGIKNTFSIWCQSSKKKSNIWCIKLSDLISCQTFVCIVVTLWHKQVTNQSKQLDFTHCNMKKMCKPGLFMMNIQCSHSTIIEHLALLAKTIEGNIQECWKHNIDLCEVQRSQQTLYFL